MIDNKTTIDFAPIQGYTDAIYRTTHNRIFGGINNYYTPFIRIENGEIRRKDIRDILPENNLDISLIPQIIFKNIEEFDILVKQISNYGYNKIDLNICCPFPMQTNRGRGSALLSNPEIFSNILKHTESYPEIKFSLKMRLGLSSPSEIINLIPIINSTYLSHITIHPRIATQQHKGELNLSVLKLFLNECKHKVIYNGDISCIDDIKLINQQFSNISEIMIGRGLLSRPSLANEYATDNICNDTELLQKIMLMHSEIYNYYCQTLQGENQILMKIKPFWEYLEPTISRKIYKQIKKSINIRKYEQAINQII